MDTKLIKNVVFALAISSTVGIIQSFALNNFKDSTINFSINKRQPSGQLHQLKLLERAPEFGFGNVISDWSFLEFLKYFGDDQSRRISGYDLSPNYMSAVLKHDPHYRFFYLFLSESTTFYAGMPDKTVFLMEKGLSSFNDNKKPADSYYVWRYKGVDELLFLNDGRAAQKSFEKAAEWATESDDKDGQLMAILSKQTAALLDSDPESTDAQIGAWSSVLTTTLDDETRLRAIRKIRELGGDVVLGSEGQLQIKYAKIEEHAEAQNPKR